MKDHDVLLLLYTFIVSFLARSSCQAQPAGVAALQAAANPLIWIMQPFEQCGGTGGLCNTKAVAGVQTCADRPYPGAHCPMTYTCQRQTAAIWQCLPQQLQPAMNATLGLAPGATLGLAPGVMPNDTVPGHRRQSSGPYQPAPIEDAGFRRYNISVWPNCAPWEYAIASRCVFAPNLTRSELEELMAQAAANGTLNSTNTTITASGVKSIACSWLVTVSMLLLAFCVVQMY